MNRTGPLRALIAWAAPVKGHARHALLRGLERALGAKTPTILDVFFAYRLLLGRVPDPEGFAHYQSRLRLPDFSVDELATELLSSAEFRARAEARAAAQRVDPYVRQPIEEETVRLDDFSIVIDRHDVFVGQEIKKKGVYERGVTAALRRLLRPGDTFVDVGANVGYFTLLASRLVGKSGSVLAYEPMPQNAGLLEKSLALNGFSNVALHRVALSNRNAPVRLAQFERRNSGSFHLVMAGADGSSEVPGRRLDDALEGRVVHVVKVDVEGAEGLVFEGMRETLRRCRPTVLMEYAPAALEQCSKTSGEALLGSFAELGYSFQDVESFDRGSQPLTHAALQELLRQRGTGHVDLVLYPRSD